MDKRLKELAEQAGLIPDGDDWFSAIQEHDVRTIDLKRFAELVRQDEREACAKLCDARGDLHGGLFGSWAQDISERIRARGNHGR